jgi:hypothetical protein
MRKFAREKFLGLCAVLCVVLGSHAAFAQGTHVTLRANLNPSPGTNVYSDVVAEGNYAYVSSWQNTSGVWIFNVSNPDAPLLVARYNPSNSKNMQGIQVLNGIGYFASDGGSGIHIVNLANPAQPKLITRITSNQGGYNKVHDLTLDGNGHMFVPNYRVNDDVQVWNVQNPAAPFLQMTLHGTDSLSVHDVTVQGNRLYMSGWGGTEDIWDITNLDTQPPVLLGSFTAGVHTQDVSVSEDGRYLFCPRELSSNGDVNVFDVSDPTNVTKVATLTQADLGIAATSPSTSKIMGNYLYVAWYQQGLVIFDISDPTNPIMVGNYDTWPGNSFGGVGGGDGDWGVWPFLGIDRILVSDRTTGLYILDASGVNTNPAAFALSFNPTSVLGSLSTTGRAYIVGISPPGGTTLNVSSENPQIPATTAFVPAGAHSATYTQPTNSVASTTTSLVTLSDGIYNAQAPLTLLPPTPSKVSVSPTPVRGGFLTTGTVTLTAPAAVDTPVALSIVSGGTAIASMPSSVIVSAGSTTGSWQIETIAVSATTQVKVGATLNGTTKTATFNVSANVPSGFSFSPSTVTGASSTTGKVTFFAPVSQDTQVTLTVASGASAVASIPATVTVTQGNSSGTFTVVTNIVSAKTTVKVTAKANGGSKTASFSVQ